MVKRRLTRVKRDEKWNSETERWIEEKKEKKMASGRDIKKRVLREQRENKRYSFP